MSKKSSVPETPKKKPPVQKAPDVPQAMFNEMLGHDEDIDEMWQRYYKHQFQHFSEKAPFDRMVAAIAHVASHQDIRTALIAMADAINHLANVLDAAMALHKENIRRMRDE